MATSDTTVDTHSPTFVTETTTSVDASTNATFVTTLSNGTGVGHQELVDRLVEQINVTLIKNSEERVGRFYDVNLTSPTASFGKNVFQWDAYRVNTVAYIGLALLCVVLLGVVSAFYVK